MPGIMKEIPKGDTYSKYGDSARKVEIGAIGNHGTFFAKSICGYTCGRILNWGRFVYAMGNKPLSACYAKTDA